MSENLSHMSKNMVLTKECALVCSQFIDPLIGRGGDCLSKNTGLEKCSLKFAGLIDLAASFTLDTFKQV